MRIVTWNCCRGAFAAKTPLLDSLRPDIAVIQECGRPLAQNDQSLWFGDNPRQGIAVVTRGEYRLRALPTIEDAPLYAVPLAVTGPLQFNLLAIWAKGRQEFPYIEGVVRAVRMYRDLLAGSPSMVIGDLNSNVIWDDEHPADMSHTALVNMLAEIGMTSAYHAFHVVAHGKEAHPTHYFRWNERQPFHIDYAFIPVDWARNIRDVAVGSYGDWKDSSDHRPLLVDCGLP